MINLEWHVFDSENTSQNEKKMAKNSIVSPTHNHKFDFVQPKTQLSEKFLGK